MLSFEFYIISDYIKSPSKGFHLKVHGLSSNFYYFGQILIAAFHHQYFYSPGTAKSLNTFDYASLGLT